MDNPNIQSIFIAWSQCEMYYKTLVPHVERLVNHKLFQTMVIVAGNVVT